MKTEEKQTRVIITIIIIGLLLLGVGIYKKIKERKEDNFIYGEGYEVRRVYTSPEAWHYNIKTYLNLDNRGFQETTLAIRSDPRDIEKIPIIGGAREAIFDSSIVYVTITPNIGLGADTVLAALEINNYLERIIGREVRSAFTEENNNQTIKKCSDATEEEAVIWLKLGEKTEIKKSEQGCIIITGVEEQDLIKAADRLVLNIVGVIK